jgi:tryptophan synthase alpha chain
MGTGRIDECLTRAGSTGQRLLAVYLTLGDPLTCGPPDLGPVIVRAGADVLELGVPTPSVGPRGTQVKNSFERARGVGIEQVWRRLGDLRRALPATPLILLIYPETVADIGWSDLLAGGVEAGADGLVLTDPTESDLARVAEAGLSGIPLIRPTMDRGVARRLERASTHLTYRNLASRTGEPLPGGSVVALAADLAAEASKPCLAGFGIRYEREIRVLVPYVAGVVVGSRFLSLMSEVGVVDRADRAAEVIGRWKAATVLPGAVGDGAVGD